MAVRESTDDTAGESEGGDAPPRVLCEDCGDPITYLGIHTGQPSTAVGMVTGTGRYVCGCEEAPAQWEIRAERGDTGAKSDPTTLHPRGCRCERCSDR